MGVTKFDTINATTAIAKIVTSLPSTPADYYGAAANDVDSVTWNGGELAAIKSATYTVMLYMQLSTSGTTANWVRLKEVLETSTTTTSTTTSTTSTTSSTSSTTSSTSSTSTTSSTTTSTSSTTTSSTTTMA